MITNVDTYFHQWEKMIQKTGLKIINFTPHLIVAIIIFIAGKWLIRLLMRIIKQSLIRYEIEPSLASFLRSLIKFVLHLLLIILVVAQLGFPTTSFIAVLSAVGLAIGLALQGSLANLAGGVLILFFKPFKIGDTILSGEHQGIVKRIDILHTTITTYDNKVIIMPNGPLANNNITNYTKEQKRRMDFNIGIAYDSDITKARKVILNVLLQDVRIDKDPAPIVVLNKLGDFTLDLIVRWWTDTEFCWEVYWHNLEKIKEALDKEGIKIPFPQREVNVRNTPL